MDAGINGEGEDDIAREFNEDPNSIQFINISEDPTQSNCLIYYCPSGESTIGTDPKNSILMEGLGMIP